MSTPPPKVTRALTPHKNTTFQFPKHIRPDMVRWVRSCEDRAAGMPAGESLRQLPSGERPDVENALEPRSVECLGQQISLLGH